MNAPTPVSRAWSWRHAITQSGMKATTRHVLLTLSVFMNGRGQSCYPSVEDLVEATGLSKRAVMEHLAIASDAGWLKRKEHGYRGQKWRRQEYEPGWPGREVDVVGDDDQDTDEGGDGGSPPSEDGVVTVVHEGGDRGASKVVTEGDQDKEHSNHQSITSPLAADDARSRAKLDALDKSLRDAGGESLHAVSTGLIVLSEPLRWLAAGCRLDEDIVPAIRSVSARSPPNSIRSWAYFAPAVIEARDRRLKPVAPPQETGGRDGPRPRRTSVEVHTDALVKAVARRRRRRERQAGADAGQGGEARTLALDHRPAGRS